MSVEKLWFVFDVESIGLDGEGFAVGWVVVDKSGVEKECGCFVCPPDMAKGTLTGHEWVKDHLVPFPKPLVGVGSPREVRDRFWAVWERWQNSAYMAADVPWPVEARFLAQCIDDNPNRSGPYPLVDIASVRLARGLDPLGTEPRLDSEVPAHHPLMDSRQSARLLVEALNA